MRYTTIASLTMAAALMASPASALRLNTSGDVVAGVGGLHVSINNKPIGQGGAAAWRTDTEVVYGAVRDTREWKVLGYQTQTKVTSELADLGASDLYAGGGVWARYLADRGKTGLTASTGFSCSSCGLLEVGPDGVIYYNTDRDHGILARYPDGRTITLVPSSQRTARALRGVPGGAIWSTDNLRAAVWNLPQPVTAPGEDVFNPRAMQVKGEWWIVYGTQTRILAHPFSTPVGYVVADLGNTFGMDAIAWPGGIRVAYSTTQGEQPGDVRFIDLDISRPRLPLARPVVPPTPVVTPPSNGGTPPPTAACGAIPTKGQQVLRELAAKFPTEIASANDDTRRVFALRMAQQLAFSVSPEWGTKKAGPGNPQTKDGVARFIGSQLCVWDVVSGSTKQLQFYDGEPIGPPQVFIPVKPINHLGSTPPPPVEPPPTTCPPDLTAEVARLNAALTHANEDANRLLAERDEARRAQIEATVAHDNAVRQLEELRNRPAPRCEAKLFGAIPVPCRVITQP